MARAGSEEELKKEFKKLAMIYHPDKGGSTALMQKLNQEYRLRKEQLEKKSVLPDDLKVGDAVFVNGSECRVTHVSAFAFIARAVYSGRTAVFDRQTGYAVGNKKFRARFHADEYVWL